MTVCSTLCPSPPLPKSQEREKNTNRKAERKEGRRGERKKIRIPSELPLHYVCTDLLR
jgi:hypothetical protein